MQKFGIYVCKKLVWEKRHDDDKIFEFVEFAGAYKAAYLQNLRCTQLRKIICYFKAKR